jgi:hypothetical protein
LSTVAFIRRCLAAGMDLDTALLAAEQFEGAPEAITPRQARNARYYQQRRLKASETSESKTPKTVSDEPKTVKTPSDADASRTRVRELSPRLVISGSDDDVDCASAISTSDDWPELKGRQTYAELLVERVASPWLDPAKSLDLVGTAGRVVAWKRDGASWEHDVVPVVTALCAKAGKRVGTWKYFDTSVAQTIADNRAALAIPEARVVPLRPGGFKSREDENRDGWDYAIARLASDEQ